MLLACRSWFFAMLSLISRIRLPRTIATSVSSLLNLPSVSIFCPIRRADTVPKKCVSPNNAIFVKL